MITIARISLLASATLLALVGSLSAQQNAMTFFVTSAGVGKGAGGKTWRAYLSTQGTGAVNARDRIGKGPWQNAKGVVIAKDVAELHGENNLTKQTALTEKGDVVPSPPEETTNRHDILTGTQADGTAFSGDKDMTCGNWTKSGEGAAMVGHVNRRGLDDSAAAKSWNSSHPSRGPQGGCSQMDLNSTGGAGFLYCFAAN